MQWVLKLLHSDWLVLQTYLSMVIWSNEKHLWVRSGAANLWCIAQLHVTHRKNTLVFLQKEKIVILIFRKKIQKFK